MEKIPKNKGRIDTVFVLMVFCVFAVSVFLVLILSGSTYRNMVDISNDGQNERVAMSYIRTKIRKNDTAGAVEITNFHGVPALSLAETFGGFELVTLIYHYDGWLKELFFERDLEFFPEDGIRLIPIVSLNFEQTGAGLIRILAGEKSMYIFPRSAGGGGL